MKFVSSFQTFILREILQYNSSEDGELWYGITLCLALFVTEMGKCITMAILVAISLETCEFVGLKDDYIHDVI